METVIIPGSYRPTTVGHCHLAKEASKRNPKKRIMMVFGINVDKDYPMTNREAKIMMENELGDDLFENGGNIEIEFSNGITYADLARKYAGAKIAFKGVRNDKDKGYETMLHYFGNEQLPDDIDNFELELYEAPDHLKKVSSSVVKSIMKSQGNVDEYMNPKNRALNEAIFKQQNMFGVVGERGVGKDRVTDAIVAAAKDILNIDLSHMNMDKIWHDIIGKSQLEQHVFIRQAISDLFPNARVLDRDGFITERGRKIISKIVFNHKDDPKELKLKQLVKIATPAIQLELYERMKHLKGGILINNAIMAENGSTGKVNHNMILVKSPYQSEQMQQRDSVNEKRATELMRFQKKTEQKKSLIEDAIQTYGTGSLTVHENLKGDPEGDAKIRNLTFNTIAIMDVDGRLRYGGLLERSGIEITPEALGLFDKLKKHYDGDRRKYHTWGHILDNWNGIYRDHEIYTNKEDLIVAEWINIFHDYEMEFHSKKGFVDEYESSLTADRELRKLGVSDAIIRRVRAGILRTKHNRNEPPVDMVEANFLARDLKILASGRGAYQKYVKQVREEYGKFNDAEFTYGRRLFLKKMLSGERSIYPIAHYEKFGAPQEKIDELYLREEKALQNMKQELLLLDAQEAYRIDDLEIATTLYQDGEVINVANASGILAMDAHTPFVLDGKEYASVTAFMNGLLFKTETKRAEIARLFGEEATNKTQKEVKLSYEYNERNEARGSKYHHRLLERALDAKFQHNPAAMEALINTSSCMLVAINKTSPGKLATDDPFVSSKVFVETLLKLRERYENKAA